MNDAVFDDYEGTLIVGGSPTARQRDQHSRLSNLPAEVRRGPDGYGVGGLSGSQLEYPPRG